MLTDITPIDRFDSPPNISYFDSFHLLDKFTQKVQLLMYLLILYLPILYLFIFYLLGKGEIWHGKARQSREFIHFLQMNRSRSVSQIFLKRIINLYLRQIGISTRACPYEHQCMFSKVIDFILNFILKFYYLLSVSTLFDIFITTQWRNFNLVFRSATKSIITPLSFICLIISY